MVEVTKDWTWFTDNVYYSGRIGYKKEDTSKGTRVRVLAGNIAYDAIVSPDLWKEKIEPWLQDNRAGEITTSVVREVFFA